MLVPWEQSRQTGSVAKELNIKMSLPIWHRAVDKIREICEFMEAL